MAVGVEESKGEGEGELLTHIYIPYLIYSHPTGSSNSYYDR